MLSTFAGAPWHGGPGFGPGGAHGFGPGGGPIFFLAPLVWLAVIALVVVLVARRRRVWAENGGPSFGPHRSPEFTLSQRFANGEIDDVEYRSRLEVLRANRPPRSADRPLAASQAGPGAGRTPPGGSLAWALLVAQYAAEPEEPDHARVWVHRDTCRGAGRASMCGIRGPAVTDARHLLQGCALCVLPRLVECGPAPYRV